MATGFPYDISYGGATSLSLWCSASWNFYACPDVPNQTGPATFGDPRIRQVSGNSVPCHSQSNADGKKAGFVTRRSSDLRTEVLGTFGNVHRNPYHGPGINNTNMIVAKNFMIVPERNISIQLRLESDNVFNHTQFANPTSNITSSNLESSLRRQPLDAKPNSVPRFTSKSAATNKTSRNNGYEKRS